MQASFKVEGGRFVQAAGSFADTRSRPWVVAANGVAVAAFESSYDAMLFGRGHVGATMARTSRREIARLGLGVVRS